MRTLANMRERHDVLEELGKKKKKGKGSKGKRQNLKRHDASAHFNIHYHPPSRNNIDNNNNVCLPFRSHIIPFNLFVLDL